MSRSHWRRRLVPSAILMSCAAASVAAADVVTEWDRTACDLVVAAQVGPAMANRVLAIVDTAVYEAVNAITGRYMASEVNLSPAPDASIPAAVAAANRATLVKLIPPQASEVDRAYRNALAVIPDGAAKNAGIAVGEAAAQAILALRAGDAPDSGEAYRPFTEPGVYVPTVLPYALQWSRRKPWTMTDAAQFRPGPPPALSSPAWARDYQEIKVLGGKNDARRTSEQTAVARFWESTAPHLYHGLARSVAESPGREVTDNARVFAAVSQATDDALIAVFDAKYHYGFWRPVTAIRNGDNDGNDATERDPAWTPFIETPLHPEYPCAHCIVAAAVGAVLEAEVAPGQMPPLRTASPSAGGSTRTWTRVEDLVREVSNARVWDGVHFRTSTEVGADMGKRIGALTAAKVLGAKAAPEVAADANRGSTTAAVEGASPR